MNFAKLLLAVSLCITACETRAVERTSNPTSSSSTSQTLARLLHREHAGTFALADGTEDKARRTSLLARAVFESLLASRPAPDGIDLEEQTRSFIQRERKQVGSWKRHLRRRRETEQSVKAAAQATVHLNALAEVEAEQSLTHQDVQGEYEAVRSRYTSPVERIAASQIQIDLPEGVASEEAVRRARAEAQRTVERVGRDPEAFARVAASRGTLNAPQGRLGVFSKETCPHQFPVELFDKPEGWVSAPIAGKESLHIFRIDRRFAPGALPLDQVAARLRERVLERKKREKRRVISKEIWSEVVELLRTQSTFRKQTEYANLLSYAESQLK